MVLLLGRRPRPAMRGAAVVAVSALLLVEDRVHADLDVDVLTAVHRLAGPALHMTDVADFGTSAWLDLDDADPRRDAAVLRAAWCWWTGVLLGSGVPAAVLRREVRRALREASWDVASAADWREIASHHVTHAELIRRRAEFGRPRGVA